MAKPNDHLENPLNPEEESTFEPENAGEQDTAKHERLAGKSPLQTFLTLSFGPLMSQISGSLYGSINSIWISRALGEIALTSIAAANSFDNIGRAFGYLLSVASSSKISALFALGEDAEALQVICDLLRTALIFGIIIPAIRCPIESITVK
jgi:Na+-driven multidrug efflux pump